MRIIRKYYSNKSTVQQICIGLSLVMILTLSLVSIVLFIQFINIKQQQQIIPNKFFSIYDKQALYSIARTNKALILDILEFRRVLINIIKTGLLSKSLKYIQNTINSTQMRIIPQNQTIQCIYSLLNKQQSIFTCNIDYQIDLLLKSLNIFQSNSNKSLKRYNIYYQNNINKQDIMLKSLSRNRITSINVSDINQRLQNIQKQQIFIFTNFYTDIYQNKQNITLAYRSKLILHNYTILIQQQGYGTFVTKSIIHNLYSQQINVIVLYPDNTQPLGYKIISNYKPINSQINYTLFFQPGYHQIQLSNGDIISLYTELFSSQYSLSKMINKYQINNQGDHILIIHSPCMNKQMEIFTKNFIDMLENKLMIFLGCSYGLLICMIFGIVIHVTKVIGKSLKYIKIYINKYLKRSQDIGVIMNSMLELKSSLQFFRNISKSLYEIIYSIQYKKRKYSKLSAKQKVKLDELPLNLIDVTFQKEHFIEEFSQLYQIREEILYKSEGASPKSAKSRRRFQ